MMTKKIIKSYTELIRLKTFEERFEYLSIKSAVGKETFGYDRYLNQILYRSNEWKTFRREIFLRDNGCDLACRDHEIHGRFIVHHINPITVDDVINRDPKVFDPENAITTILMTHNAIHYGDKNLLVPDPIERTVNDTCLWKRRV